MTGATGATGAAGPQGPTGAQGPQGPVGLSGATGATGSTGAAGPQGPAGPQGATGTNGTNGIDGKTVWNGTDDPAGGTGVNGDFYINTTTHFIFGPKTGGAWGAGTSLVGPQGPPGGGSDGWALTGNAGTVAGTNFLGTTDNIPFEVRVNNERAGWVSPANYNTSWGTHALAVAAGNLNTAVGRDALDAATASATENVAIGALSLSGNQNGIWNTAVGTGSLYASVNASRNTGLGTYSLYQTSTGNQNTGVGTEALTFNTTGSNNTALGNGALYSNTSGLSNVAIGHSALYNNADRHNIVAIGDSALFNNSVGAGPIVPIEGLYPAMFNTAVGSKALFSNNSGNSNTSVGRLSMYSTTSGYGNTALGTGAMYNNVGGINNVAIGSNSGGPSSGANNFISIGYVAGYVGGASNTVEIGNQSMTWIGGQTGWFNYSDGRVKDRVQENVAGLEFIKRLRPVTYHFDLHKEYEMVHGERKVDEWDGKYDLEQRQMTGFIAQEVEAAAKASGYDFSGVRAPEGTSKLYSLSYGEFVVPLVKAVQEQQALIEKLTRRIEELEHHRK